MSLCLKEVQQEVFKGLPFFGWKIRADHTIESWGRPEWDSQGPCAKAKTLRLPHLPLCPFFNHSISFIPTQDIKSPQTPKHNVLFQFFSYPIPSPLKLFSPHSPWKTPIHPERSFSYHDACMVSVPHSGFYQVLIWLLLHAICKCYCLYSALPTILQDPGE